MRLEKKLKVPPEDCHICEGGLKSATDVYIEGERVRPGGILLDTALRVVGKGPGQTQGLAWSNRRELSPKKPKEEVSKPINIVRRIPYCPYKAEARQRWEVDLEGPG